MQQSKTGSRNEWEEEARALLKDMPSVTPLPFIPPLISIITDYESKSSFNTGALGNTFTTVGSHNMHSREWMREQVRTKKTEDSYLWLLDLIVYHVDHILLIQNSPLVLAYVQSKGDCTQPSLHGAEILSWGHATTSSSGTPILLTAPLLQLALNVMVTCYLYSVPTNCLALIRI